MRQPALVPVAGVAVKDGKLAFDVRNSGNVHFVLLSARATGLDREGKVLFDKQREGWYVLSGDTRRYELDLTKKECTDLATVRLPGK